MREAKAAYYGLTTFMDNCVGQILGALDESQQSKNTIVIYVSDHGDMLGDQGFWTKQVMYEQSAGVPMIISGPNIPQNHIVNTGTSLLDLAATAADISNTSDSAFSKSLKGISLRRLANEEDNADRTIFSEYHDGGSTTGTFMVRWKNWKYVYYVGHSPQLFDLKNDPKELNDIAELASENPQIRETLDEGDRRLREICDPEFVNQTCFEDQKAKIIELGGEEACLTAYSFNHTPTPSEQAKMREGSAL